MMFNQNLIRYFVRLAVFEEVGNTLGHYHSAPWLLRYIHTGKVHNFFFKFLSRQSLNFTYYTKSWCTYSKNLFPLHPKHVKQAIWVFFDWPVKFTLFFSLLICLLVLNFLSVSYFQSALCSAAVGDGQIFYFQPSGPGALSHRFRNSFYFLFFYRIYSQIFMCFPIKNML